MKKYIVKTKFVFEGVFEVNAANRQEARRIVGEDCGMALGRTIHTSNGSSVSNWNFPIHPEKQVVSVKVRKSNHTLTS
jgi:hypothetical protein